jgi:hypothetical protein
MELTDKMEPLAHKALRVFKEQQVQMVYKVLPAHKGWMAQQVHRVQQVLKAFQE